MSIFLMVGVVAGPGCGNANKYIEPPPPEVIVAKPTKHDVVNYIEVTGTAQPI
jgi:hypothetical protein